MVSRHVEKDMRMKELGLDDRPREKLLEKGASALSNAELLAILIRTGTQTENAVEVARRLIQAAGGSLAGVADMPLSGMVGISGLGRIKAAGISAALELGRRFMAEASTVRKVSIISPGMVYSMMHPYMKGLDHEECWVIYLNRARYVIGKEKLFSGGLSSTLLDARMIVKHALDRHADGLILTHNHPSGNPRPGTEDIRQTETLRNALRTFELSLVDHVVIAEGSFYSFADMQVETAGVSDELADECR